ncbi:MAG: ATP-binding protein [Terriglobales bacterium]
MSTREPLRRLEQVGQRYRLLLERPQAEPDEESLQQAYLLGRELLAVGASLLEVADLHHRTLAGWMTQATTDSRRAWTRAAALLRELLAGYEMLLRGYSDANLALRSMNDRMEQHVERIARALHDESGQVLAAVMIRLDQALQALPVGLRTEVAELRPLLDQVEFQLRRIAHELHPALLTDLGLRPALEFLADGVAARSGLNIAIEGELPRRLSATVELCLYRCAQECLNNVVRHAHARHVRVRMSRTSGGLEIRIADDGCGFAPQLLSPGGVPPGLGLAGMRERLRGVEGELEIRAHPGAGAEICLRVPDWQEGGGDAGPSAARR